MKILLFIKIHQRVQELRMMQVYETVRLSVNFCTFCLICKPSLCTTTASSLQRLQAGLATAHAEILKLQQENAFLRKQLAPKLPTTDISPLSEHTTSPIVFSH
jgi:hypothetical protein